MGDAGPLTPPLGAEPQITTAAVEHETSAREVTVLVTGFGPFKSFATNPSYLIASALPSILPAQSSKPPSPTDASSASPSSPDPPTPPQPDYRIRLITHPSPIRVAYATISTILPTLLTTHSPDYVFHIGMAGGRDHYTLETVAHRDAYKIKDVDDRDGWKEGEYAWKRDGVPDKLPVGWDEADVCARWDAEVRDLETAMGLVAPPERERDGLPAMRFGEWGRNERRRVRSVCRLSVDAGRFLCEFTLFESLAWRWLGARGREMGKDADKKWDATVEVDGEGGEVDEGLVRAREREGKVAFLHVPGAFGPEDVERGVRVAAAAIRSFVGSWEEGRRRKDGQELGTKMQRGRWDGVVWRA